MHFKCIDFDLVLHVFWPVCDPVLGDDGVFYVPRELVTVYKEEVIALATILTPNQFECEYVLAQPALAPPCPVARSWTWGLFPRVLSDVTITDSASAVASMDVLHAKGVRCVVITSSNLPAGQTEVSARVGEGKSPAFNGV